MKPPISQWGLPKHSNTVTLAVGSPGSGKTVICYNVADEIHGDRIVYCPMSKQFGRPEYYKRWQGKYPDNSVIMVNDAAMQFAARTWYSEKGVEIGPVQNVRRHSNIDFIWDVQNSGNLDKSIIRDVDCLILKEPSLLQSKFERDEIGDYYEKAKTANMHWGLKDAYVITHKKEFILTEIDKPKYWNEDISTDDIGKEQDQPFWKKWGL